MKVESETMALLEDGDLAHGEPAPQLPLQSRLAWLPIASRLSPCSRKRWGTDSSQRGHKSSAGKLDRNGEHALQAFGFDFGSN